MRLLYSIKTLAGVRHVVEADSSEDALRVAGVRPENCRRWYPFPLKVVAEPLAPEVRAKLEVLRMERSNPCNVCGNPTWSKKNVCRECQRIGERR